ncbi:uncharacterized protein LOC113352746 [Papaver somniferum]|uniref:uncharacterized protein LOC113352746 n=1 Tax=Papaver somniferum TaxID=3469 RepID=UPI000E6FD6AD|nr:uncharacterized protein LOC113352746 [Papaver somniferum]
MDRDRIDLKEFEQMLRVKLNIDETEIPNLYWTIDPCLPEYLITNEDFFKFWEHVVPDDKGFICLQMSVMNSEFRNDNDFIKAAMEQPVVTIDETPKKAPKRIAKKPVSKEKSIKISPTRRSPRFHAQSKNENSNGGASRKLLFMDLLNEVESQGFSCLSQATVVGSSSTPVDNFNHDYWVDEVTNTAAGDNTDANTTVDECHPIEDPNAPPIFDSDEENDIDYEDIVKTYKVGDESSDSSSSEKDNEEVSNDDKNNDKDNDGPEVNDDKYSKPKLDYQKTIYADAVNPLEDISEWNWEDKASMNINLKPPPYQRKTGRPAKKRKMSYDEPETVVKKRKCGKCGSTAGHNKRTCDGGDVGKNPTGFMPSTEYDAANCTFTSRDHPESSTARG